MSTRETIKNSKQHGEMKKDEVITNLHTFKQTKGAFSKTRLVQFSRSLYQQSGKLSLQVKKFGWIVSCKFIDKNKTKFSFVVSDCVSEHTARDK